MNKKTVIFIILYTIVFSIVVVFKFINNNKFVNLNEEFSLQKDQVISIRNSDFTKIKLVSIDKSSDCNSDNCSLSYKFLINGKEYYIKNIPSTNKIDGGYSLAAIDADEDRIILKISES